MITEQQPRAGGFLLAEGPGFYSRDVVTFRAGHTIRAGAVIAKLQAGDWQPLEPGGSGTSDVAAGISFDSYDASEGAVDGVAIVRGPCVVKLEDLVWPEGISDGDKLTALEQLEALGIIARSASETVQLGLP